MSAHDELLIERLAKLSPEKRALYQRRLEQSAAHERSDAIPVLAQRSPAPLSFAQQRQLFLERLEPGNVTYNLQRAMRLRGPLNVQALERALSQLIARHESLRTSFVEHDGTAAAIVASPFEISLPVVELSVADNERDTQTEQLLRAEWRTPFDLTQAPLVRFMLVRYGADDHLFAFTFHHIITDGWSMGVFEHELSTLYAAACEGRSAGLPALPIGYADFSAWQRRSFSGPALEEQVEYWRHQLAAPIPQLDLPADRPPTGRSSGAGAAICAPLPPELIPKLHALAQSERVTFFMLMLAAFQLLMQRYSGQDDIIVGTPVANRTRTELEPLIGFFVNTLVLRNDLSGDPTVRELLGRVRTNALAAFDRQDIPFEKLVEALAPERNLGGTPFFRTMFLVQNAPNGEFTLHGLEVTRIAIDPGTAKFDIMLGIDERAGHLTTRVEYRTELFDAGRIEQLIEHYHTLLAGMVADPDQHISRVPLLTEGDRKKLAAWNATVRPYPRETTLAALFTEQARETPDAVALSSADAQMSYAELEIRSNRLAHYLRTLGAEREAPIGLCFERSTEAIVAILGILKAGAAYVPLDTAYPRERLAHMVADSGVQLILADEHLAAALPTNGARVIVPEHERATINAQSADPPSSVNSPDDLAYVMYTSGSTGAPKGVEVVHRAIVRLVRNTNYLDFMPSDVFLLLAPVSFDASTLEIWGALLNGARLAIMPPGPFGPREIADVLRAERVSVLWLTAPLFATVLDDGIDAFRGVRALLTGGDVVSPTHAARVVREIPTCKLFNGYGPTENTTFTTVAPITNETGFDRPLPIGPPIANTSVFVLDRHRELVPPGIPGELYTGGDGLARGYRNHPEMTAERFVRTSFAERLYKTGDRVRWRDDGQLEFLERFDHQVKLRGHRIELGEIETTLSHHPGVRECVVIVHGAGAEKRLVAYVIARDHDGATVPEMRQFLAASLPEYMIPSQFILLAEFLLSPNGKVDRKALPTPEARVNDVEHAEPTTPLEVQLGAIWEDVLERSTIGLDDNFFELGGHSLLAMRLMSRIEAVTGATLPIRVLFEYPTVRSLAQALIEGQPSIAMTRYLAVNMNGALPPFFLLHGYFNGGLYTVNLSRHLGVEQPFYALHPHDSDGAPETLPASVEAMAEDHLKVIRSIQPAGPYYIGGFCNGAAVAYEVAQRLQRAGEKVAVLAVFTSWPPARVPVLRRLTMLVARVRKMSRERELEIFLRVRNYTELLTSFTALKRRLAARKQRRAAAVVPPKTIDAAAESAPSEYQWDQRSLRYIDVMSRYAPPKYKGKITMFWAEDAYPWDEALNAWRKRATSVEAIVLPGGANTSLTHHPEFIAKKLSAVLAAAREQAR